MPRRRASALALLVIPVLWIGTAGAAAVTGGTDVPPPVQSLLEHWYVGAALFVIVATALRLIVGFQRFRKDVFADVHETIKPLIRDAIEKHDDSDDAHPKLMAKVLAPVMAKLDAIHADLIELRATYEAKHKDLVRRVEILEDEAGRRRRGDTNGTDWPARRQGDDAPRRKSDPEGFDAVKLKLRPEK